MLYYVNIFISIYTILYHMMISFEYYTVTVSDLCFCEAVSDLSVASPLMLGISVARVVSGFINRHAYDEQLVILKQIPYLEAEPPTQQLSDACKRR